MLKKIKSENDYRAALKRIDELWGCNSESQEAYELNALVDLICEYEFSYGVIVPISVFTREFNQWWRRLNCDTELRSIHVTRNGKEVVVIKKLIKNLPDKLKNDFPTKFTLDDVEFCEFQGLLNKIEPINGKLKRLLEAKAPWEN